MRKKTDKLIYSMIVENKEFYFFLKKFFGSFVFRGNKSRAIKMIDEIIFRLKKVIRRDPVHIFYRIFKKLVPIFSIAYKRVGNRYQPIPKFASKNVRIVLMISWLLRNYRGKSNVRGIKVNDIIKVLIDTYRGKGRALAAKKLFISVHYLVVIYLVVINEKIRNLIIKGLDDVVLYFNVFKKT